MNSLEAFILKHGLSEVETMNHLQEHGVISDLAVWARDVAEADWPAAIAELQRVWMLAEKKSCSC